MSLNAKDIKVGSRWRFGAGGETIIRVNARTDSMVTVVETTTGGMSTMSVSALLRYWERVDAAE